MLQPLQSRENDQTKAMVKVPFKTGVAESKNKQA